MPFCTSCGHQNTDEARFCNGCGQQVAVAAQPAQTAAPPGPAQQPVYQQPAPPPPAYPQHAYRRPAKDKTTATVLAWVFWPALDFYLGNPGKAIAKLLTFGGLGVWVLIDAIKLLSMPQQEFDARYNSRRW